MSQRTITLIQRDYCTVDGEFYAINILSCLFRRLFHYIINMGQTQSKGTDKLSVQDTENDMDNIRRLAENEGPIAVDAYIDNILNRWEKEQVNFGIAGRFSTGKSTFINTVRHVQKGDDEYAEIGSAVTTITPTLYLHPKNHRIVFYDLPGHSSKQFKKEDYISKANISDYDFVFIFFEHDLSEEEIWLSGELRKLHKPFALVQSKIDLVITEAITKGKVPNTIIKQIRERHEEALNSYPELNGIKPIFLISSTYPDLKDWSDLMAYVEGKFDGFKKAFLYSVDAITKEILERKYKMLQKRLVKVTIIAAGVAAVPVPGVDFAVNIGILVHEVRHYMRVFRVEPERVNTLEDFDQSLLKCRSLLKPNVDIALFVGTKIATYATVLFVQSFIDLFLPIVGSVISSVTAASYTYKFLVDILQDIKDDAVLIYEHIMKIMQITECKH